MNPVTKLEESDPDLPEESYPVARARITNGTYVSLGLLLLCLTTIGGGAWKVASAFKQTEDNVNARVDAFAKSFEERLRTSEEKNREKLAENAKTFDTQLRESAREFVTKEVFNLQITSLTRSVDKLETAVKELSAKLDAAKPR